MACKFPKWSILLFASFRKHNGGHVMVGNIPLSNSMIEKLPLLNFLWLVSLPLWIFSWFVSLPLLSKTKQNK